MNSTTHEGLLKCDEDWIVALEAYLIQGNVRAMDMVVIPLTYVLSERVFERTLRLTRPGGLVVVLGTLGADVQPYRDQWNDRIFRDERVVPATVPLGAGITLLLVK